MTHFIERYFYAGWRGPLNVTLIRCYHWQLSVRELKSKGKALTMSRRRPCLVRELGEAKKRRIDASILIADPFASCGCFSHLLGSEFSCRSNTSSMRARSRASACFISSRMDLFSSDLDLAIGIGGLRPFNSPIYSSICLACVANSWTALINLS